MFMTSMIGEKIVIMVQMKESQVNVVFIRIKYILLIHEYIFISVACDAPNFCCESGVQGDQECRGKCIREIYINDGEANCDNASDEGGSGMLYRI